MDFMTRWQKEDVTTAVVVKDQHVSISIKTDERSKQVSFHVDSIDVVEDALDFIRLSLQEYHAEFVAPEKYLVDKETGLTVRLSEVVEDTGVAEDVILTTIDNDGQIGGVSYTRKEGAK